MLRRALGWEPEDIEGAEAVLDLPEVGVAFRLAELHGDAGAT
jgi:hypothetical protein